MKSEIGNFALEIQKLRFDQNIHFNENRIIDKKHLQESAKMIFLLVFKRNF